MSKRQAKLAGFAAGFIGTIVLGILAGVIATGQPFGVAPDPVPPVYTVF